MTTWQAFWLGFSLGAMTLWLYFLGSGLIRSRKEWYAYRKLKRELRRWHSEG